MYTTKYLLTYTKLRKEPKQGKMRQNDPKQTQTDPKRPKTSQSKPKLETLTHNNQRLPKAI